MKPTQEMYTTLFNGITDARRQLQAAMELLDAIQLKAESLYMECANEEDAESAPK